MNIMDIFLKNVVQTTCFASVVAAIFWHFIFISKVNFVTLAQTVSETQHCKKVFPLAGNSWQIKSQGNFPPFQTM